MSNARKPRNRRNAQGAARQRRAHDPAGRFAPDLGHFAGILNSVNAAEARGDVELAMSIIDQVRVGPDGKRFWAPARELRLAQLWDFQGQLPGWAISRWLTAQALQQLDPGATGRSRRALDRAIVVRGEVTRPGWSRIDARSAVMDHDWVYRQLFLYDEGGLGHFLPRVAPDLRGRADRIEVWAEARMSGYRLVSCEPTTLLWEDLASGHQTELPNLGAASLVEVGECAIGRVVPMGGGSIFESAPLEVPGDVAEAVSAAPDRWVDPVRELVRELTDSEGPEVARSLLSNGHDFALLTDVPQALWRTASRGVVGHLCDDPFEVVADAVHLIELSCTGPASMHEVSDRFWPSLAAAIVIPGVLPRLQHRLGPEDARRLLGTAEHLTEPAATLLRDLAWSLRRAS